MYLHIRSLEGIPPSPRLVWASGYGDLRPISTVFLLTTRPVTRRCGLLRGTKCMIGWKGLRFLKGTMCTPLKINMEHNHGGLENHVPFFSWVMCRFHVNLPGCFFKAYKRNNIRIPLPSWGLSWCDRTWMNLDLVNVFCTRALLLMAEMLHQLRLVVYPIIYRVLMGFIYSRCRISAINSRTSFGMVRVSFAEDSCLCEFNDNLPRAFESRNIWPDSSRIWRVSHRNANLLGHVRVNVSFMALNLIDVHRG